MTNVIFYLKAGENVYHALKSTKTTVSRDIQKDIAKIIDGLEKESELKTGHFEKYQFPALDQFHQNLAIKYKHGGDPTELFGRIQQNMMFELKKRDELYRKRKAFALNVHVLLGMVASMALILRLLVPTLWDTFLSFQTGSVVVLLMTYGFILLNLFFLQKKKVDISVRM